MDPQPQPQPLPILLPTPLPLQPQPQPQYFQCIALLAALIGILYLIVYGLDIAHISSHWAENRCKPHVLPFASFYGYNTSENFNYCMKHVIADQAGRNLGPIYQILATFVGTLSTLLASANSLRLSLATLVGGITKVFQEFTERMNALLTRIRISTVRMKLLFSRLFATFYAMMYMGMSGVTAATNFGDTFLFKFLDTFCFDPTTSVSITRASVPCTLPVRDVRVGDIFTKTGSTVTATFSFIADGQPMVYIDNILVSTNHYIKTPTGGYVKAIDHANAVAAGDWFGGAERPLICFNTSDHHIPVGDCLFLDYDETDAANEATMTQLQAQINGVANESRRAQATTIREYSPGVHEATYIQVGRRKDAHEAKQAKDIVLGEHISVGTVIGIVKKRVRDFIHIHGDIVSASSLLWDPSTHSWKRGYELAPVAPIKDPSDTTVAYSFIVSPSATIETRQGTVLRDYMEVMSPDAEKEYTKQIESQDS